MGFDPNNFNPSQHSNDNDGNMVPPGAYICLPVSAKRTKERGKPQIDFIIQPIINSETGEVMGDEYSGLFETATLTEKAVWRFANMCDAIQTGAFNANDDQEIKRKILGKPFKAVIAKDTYQGKEKRKIVKYKGLNSADEKRYNRWKENNALETSMGDGGGGGYQKSEPDDIDDEDIPF